MIVLERSDRFSLDLSFDREGLIELIKIFNKMSETREEQLSIMWDMAIFKGKRCIIEKVICICYTDDSESKILKNDVEIKLIIERDELEYAKERFRECLAKKYFSPAEFIQIQVDKRKNLDYIFCKTL